MDWIASEHDVLNVIAGNQNGDLQRVPSDNYNGITVARSELMNGVYQKVNAGNDNEGDDDAEGDRVSVDLMAPGVDVTVADAGASNPTTTATGTSFAAPHVTGTVALLNEYGDYQVANSGSARWDSDNTRKHEVMKAVLLNSADKLAGANGSGREVVDENGNNWEQSPAFMNDQISLDQQMGAGHLNARRAATQFSTGEYNNGESVPMLGWDYGETGGLGTTLSYPLAENFAGGYVTVTLAWDRGVIKSGGLDDTYDPSNMFTGQFVDDLDLFICPVGWTDPYTDAVAKSISSEDNVEHIFKSIGPGSYEIVVNQTQGNDRDFGLAWWFGAGPSGPIQGDFDEDGDVDQADLTKWKNEFGTNFDGNDFLAWQGNYGFGVPATPTSAAVPEPAACLLALIGLPMLRRRR
jgi:hypothetical protein